MQNFLHLWHKSVYTTTGMFWMAFWAFGLGYFISSMIQVFVTRERMKQSMGEARSKSVALGTFFGFISSSCSFAALSTTRALFAKGAGLIPSLAFLLASTNLVIELGIIIAVFLSWQFVVAEYLGGLILIGLMWLVIKVTYPKSIVENARESAQKEQGNDHDENPPDWKQLISSREGWIKVAKKYVMEWKMVWKDVAVGFTVAGIIAAFVPKEFFQTLFVGSGSTNPGFFHILLQTLVGPIAAFFTFIGSMGNIPLAAVLYGNGVSFAGIIAFIFSDLVVFPVLRIQSKYYGWKMAAYILAVFLFVLVCAALILHYGFAFFNLLPDVSVAKSVTDREFFKIDYTFWLNILFILLSSVCVFQNRKHTEKKHHHGSKKISENILFYLSVFSFTWIVGGLIIPPLIL